MRILFFIGICTVLLCSCGKNARYAGIEEELRRYLNGVDADVGVAVVAGDGEMFGVNLSQPFPMLSVMKFPLALAVADAVREKGGSFDDSLWVSGVWLHPDTYSPMLHRYGGQEIFRITLGELLDYSLRLSDNNACDILIDFVGGTSVVDAYLDSLGFEDICVKWSEDDMHKVLSRCYDNVSTPAAMALLVDAFDRRFDDSCSLFIKRIMETCDTGKDRLPGAFVSLRAVIGHKTGTGDVDPETGRLIAVNDVGYVHLPDGKRYTIAVFITRSVYSLEETSAVIARISDIVRTGLCR